MERPITLTKEKIEKELQKYYWLLAEKYRDQFIKDRQQGRIIVFIDRGAITAVQQQSTTSGSTLLDIELQKVLV